MKAPEIAAIQARINASGLLSTPLEEDGFFGHKTSQAVRDYCRRLMPARNPWPSTDQPSLQAFYGSPGDESQLVRITFPFPMLYDGQTVTGTRVHKKCADSLLRILTRIGDRYSTDRGVIEEAEDYGGVFNNRPMRGGSLPSLHARGAAIDLDADDNGNHTPWPTSADMPLEIIEEFSREGWMSAAVWWNRDAMHFQATRPD